MGAQEQGLPQGRDRIEGKLITNRSVRSRSEALEKISWYARRGTMEMFHTSNNYLAVLGCLVDKEAQGAILSDSKPTELPARTPGAAAIFPVACSANPLLARPSLMPQ
jgi:hypothetical protein